MNINNHGGSRPGSGKKPSLNPKKKQVRLLNRNNYRRKRGKVIEGMFDVHAMENWAI